jgi:mannose-6-phosphate isomerase-like protein (cupin superfamily)
VISSCRSILYGGAVSVSEDDEYYFEEGCYILEYHNDPADPDVSIARARVPTGGSTRNHWLIDTTERYLVLEGHGDVVVGRAAPRPVGPGEVIVIPSGTPQHIRNTGSGDLVFLAICTPRFETENYRDDT